MPPVEPVTTATSPRAFPTPRSSGDGGHCRAATTLIKVSKWTLLNCRAPPEGTGGGRVVTTVAEDANVARDLGAHNSAAASERWRSGTKAATSAGPTSGCVLEAAAVASWLRGRGVQTRRSGGAGDGQLARTRGGLVRDPRVGCRRRGRQLHRPGRGVAIRPRDSEPAAIIGGAPFRPRLDPLAVEAGDVPVLWAEGVRPAVGRSSESRSSTIANETLTTSQSSRTRAVPPDSRRVSCTTTVSSTGNFDCLRTCRAIERVTWSTRRSRCSRSRDICRSWRAALRAGGAVLLADRFDAAELSRAFPSFRASRTSRCRHRCSTRSCDSPRMPGRSSRLFVCSPPVVPHSSRRSAPASRALVGVPVSQGYGMTEVLGVLVADYEGDAPWGSCGRIRPLSSSDIVVLDDDGRVLDAGEVGEFRGASETA